MIGSCRSRASVLNEVIFYLAFISGIMDSMQGVIHYRIARDMVADGGSSDIDKNAIAGISRASIAGNGVQVGMVWGTTSYSYPISGVGIVAGIAGDTIEVTMQEFDAM